MKLSWVESKRYVGWTKWIGRTAANNKPRCFYLGKDRTEAELKAVRLTLAYKRLVAAGAAGWTDAAIKAALDTPVTPPAAPVAPPGTIQPTPDTSPTQRGLMLYDAFDAYVKYEEGRAPNETTYAFSNGQRIRVRRLKKMMPNKLLAGVGYDDLAALVSKAASRPVSKLTKERISVVTAVDTIKCARAVFDWMDTSERWIAPRRFERIFRINRNALLTCEERDDHTEGVKTFSVDELVKISEMAWTRWHRLFIWSALNLAMTQFELSSISRRHLKGFDTDKPRIEKCREKTNVFCRWGFIFPEVADGMRWLMDTHNRDIVFVGPNGRPPVRFHPDQLRKFAAEKIEFKIEELRKDIGEFGISFLWDCTSESVQELVTTLKIATRTELADLVRSRQANEAPYIVTASRPAKARQLIRILERLFGEASLSNTNNTPEGWYRLIVLTGDETGLAYASYLTEFPK